MEQAVVDLQTRADGPVPVERAQTRCMGSSDSAARVRPLCNRVNRRDAFAERRLKMKWELDCIGLQSRGCCSAPGPAPGLSEACQARVPTLKPAFRTAVDCTSGPPLRHCLLLSSLSISFVVHTSGTLLATLIRCGELSPPPRSLLQPGHCPKRPLG